MSAIAILPDPTAALQRMGGRMLRLQVSLFQPAWLTAWDNSSNLATELFNDPLQHLQEELASQVRQVNRSASAIQETAPLRSAASLSSTNYLVGLVDRPRSGSSDSGLSDQPLPGQVKRLLFDPTRQRQLQPGKAPGTLNPEMFLAADTSWQAEANGLVDSSSKLPVRRLDTSPAVSLGSVTARDGFITPVPANPAAQRLSVSGKTGQPQKAVTITAERWPEGSTLLPGSRPAPDARESAAEDSAAVANESTRITHLSTDPARLVAVLNRHLTPQTPENMDLPPRWAQENSPEVSSPRSAPAASNTNQPQSLHDSHSPDFEEEPLEAQVERLAGEQLARWMEDLELAYLRMYGASGK